MLRCCIKHAHCVARHPFCAAHGHDVGSRRLLQAHQSEKDQRLLSASKRFDSGFSRFDLSVWNGLLHEDVVLHKDKLTLREDIHGIDAVKAYFQVAVREMYSSHDCCLWLLPDSIMRSAMAHAGSVTSSVRCMDAGLHRQIQL